jgi:hypothetical protein
MESMARKALLDAARAAWVYSSWYGVDDAGTAQRLEC